MHTALEIKLVASTDTLDAPGGLGPRSSKALRHKTCCSHRTEERRTFRFFRPTLRNPMQRVSSQQLGGRPSSELQALSPGSDKWKTPFLWSTTVFQVSIHFHVSSRECEPKCRQNCSSGLICKSLEGPICRRVTSSEPPPKRVLERDESISAS